MMCDSPVDNQERSYQFILLAMLTQETVFPFSRQPKENRGQKSWNSVKLDISFNLGREKSERTTKELFGEENHTHSQLHCYQIFRQPSVFCVTGITFAVVWQVASVEGMPSFVTDYMEVRCVIQPNFHF